MNCQDFETLLVDLARQQPVDAGLRERALVHIEVCAGCAARFASERALTAELRALAASLEAAQAPPGLEAALRAAFRGQRAKPAVMWQWWRGAMPIAASFVILVAGAVALLRRAPAPELAQPAASQELTTEFIPLVYENGLFPAENVQIVRVKLPRIALVSFGLPINEDRAGEPVKADVLLGDDGVARAIRFVRQY
jgi:hypothetical protein